MSVSAWLELIGLAGIIVMLAGMHQLWLAREEVMFWLQRFFDIFRTALGQSARAADASRPQPPKLSTLHLVGGVGLIALGSFLCLVTLALVLIGSRSSF